MQLRDATPDDIDALRGVFRRSSWSNEGDRPAMTTHPEWLHWDPDPSMLTRLAVVDGIIGGFASGRPEATFMELVDLFTEPAMMRRGIATALVDDIVRIAARLGLASLDVAANPHATAFYERAGFVLIGTVTIESGPVPRMRREITT